MRILNIIFAFTLCHILFSEDAGKQLIKDNPIEISLMDTNGLDPKLKFFLNNFYQKNYTNNEFIKTVKSIQFTGTYKVNGENAGTIKIIKKRPNKYKSYLRDLKNTEQIIIFDGKTLKFGQTDNENLTISWEDLDSNDPENLWIHFDQLFDAIMLNPKDPNKVMTIGIAYMDEGRVIQPVIIELKNKIKVTQFVSIRDNLVKKTLLEYNEPGDPSYSSYSIHYENYEQINGIMFPMKTITELSEDLMIETEYLQIKFNQGISDFFFKATSL